MYMYEAQLEIPKRWGVSVGEVRIFSGITHYACHNACHQQPQEMSKKILKLQVHVVRPKHAMKDAFTQIYESSFIHSFALQRVTDLKTQSIIAVIHTALKLKPEKIQAWTGFEPMT